jgi:uncharacterized ubiquitin-like protein YukD
LNYSLFLPIIKVMPTSDLSAQQLQEHRTLIDILLADNVITQQQYDDIKVKSASQNLSSESILESMGIVDDKKLTEERAKLLGVPFVSLDTKSFAPQAISLIPKSVVERFSLIPFEYDEKAKSGGFGSTAICCPKNRINNQILCGSEGGCGKSDKRTI